MTYKWPSWLHKQSEKQRIIWAYKILFLDVLFPLGLKKARPSALLGTHFGGSAQHCVLLGRVAALAAGRAWAGGRRA